MGEKIKKYFIFKYIRKSVLSRLFLSKYNYPLYAMAKFVYLFIIALSISACKNNSKISSIDSDYSVSVDTLIVSDSSILIGDKISLDDQKDKYSENYSFQGIRIYEPRYYREYYYKDLFAEGDSVVAILVDRDKSVLHESQILSIEIGEDECAGCQVMFPVLSIGNEDCRFIIKGLSKFNKGIETYSDPIQLPLPSRKFDIVLSGVKYTFIAEGIDEDGKIIDDDNQIKEWDSVKMYKLYVESKGKRQLLMDLVDGFQDTSPELIWVNDIDGDFKPDFIISTSPFYETSRILLFLSSFAEDGEHVKMVAITVDHFDC